MIPVCSFHEPLFPVVSDTFSLCILLSNMDRLLVFMASGYYLSYATNDLFTSRRESFEMAQHNKTKIMFFSNGTFSANRRHLKCESQNVCFIIPILSQYLPLQSDPSVLMCFLLIEPIIHWPLPIST